MTKITKKLAANRAARRAIKKTIAGKRWEEMTAAERIIALALGAEGVTGKRIRVLHGYTDGEACADPYNVARLAERHGYDLVWRHRVWVAGDKRFWMVPARVA